MFCVDSNKIHNDPQSEEEKLEEKMRKIHRSTQTEIPMKKFQILRLKMKNILNFISSLIVPLTFGLFTILLTIEQNRTNRQHRIDDRKESFEQRREQLLIATEERELQMKISNERYTNELFLSFIKDTGETLAKGFGPTERNVFRAKVRNVLRQLDGNRASQILQFLYETGQLTDSPTTESIDLSSIKLSNLTGYIFNYDPDIGPIFLQGVSIYDSSFEKRLFFEVLLRDNQFFNVDFSGSSFQSSSMCGSSFETVNFSSTYHRNTDLSLAQFFNADFRNVKFYEVDLSFIKFKVRKLFISIFSIQVE